MRVSNYSAVDAKRELVESYEANAKMHQRGADYYLTFSNPDTKTVEKFQALAHSYLEMARIAREEIKKMEAADV